MWLAYVIHPWHPRWYPLPRQVLSRRLTCSLYICFWLVYPSPSFLLLSPPFSSTSAVFVAADADHHRSSVPWSSRPSRARRPSHLHSLRHRRVARNQPTPQRRRPPARTNTSTLQARTASSLSTGFCRLERLQKLNQTIQCRIFDSYSWQSVHITATQRIRENTLF